MNNQRWVAAGLFAIAAAIVFVGCALWRQTNFLMSQTPEAKAGHALLDEFSAQRKHK